MKFLIILQDYKEISKNEFIEYEKKIALHLDPDALVNGLDIELSGELLPHK